MNTEISTLLDLSKLNWCVTKEPIQTKNGIDIPDRFAIMRDDTKSILGVLGNNYMPVQNEELLELLFQISQSTGLTFHSGGSFGLGEKVWFQLKSNTLDLGNDKVHGYISGFNSFDGKTMLALGNTHVTVSCLNTFNAGYREVDTKMRHSSTMREKIQIMLGRVSTLRKEEEHQFEIIKRMNHTKFDMGLKDKLIDILFQITPDEKIKGLSTRKANMINTFNTDWDTEIQSKGGNNLWAAFSGITRFTTHSMYKSKERAQEMKMFGKTGDLERQIWSTTSKLVTA